MTVVRYKNRMNGEPAFNNLLSDLFTQFPSLNRDEVRQAVPVNIRETEKDYFLDIVAPGLAKEDFTIDIENNLLTVSVENKEENAGGTQKFVRQEYRQKAFKRSFTLDEKIDTEAISAQYVNGFLTINLPKKAEVKPAVKQISVQ